MMQQSQRAPRPRVIDMHAHLVCVLCGGYYIDATTIVECLHSFCRSCIVRYLESSKFCPMCDVQVHKTRPLLNLRSDKTLQNLVYKLVPGVYALEMKRRREYCAKLKEKDTEGSISTVALPSEDCETPEIFSENDSISLSIEWYTGEEAEEDGASSGEAVDEKQTETEATLAAKEKAADCKQEDNILNKFKRYLKCPAALTVRHLKKFIRAKHSVSPEFAVDLIYLGECLREEYTLMDVAYIFSWKRDSHLRFFFRIYPQARVTHIVERPVADRSVSDSGGGTDEPPAKRPRVVSSENAAAGSGQQQISQQPPPSSGPTQEAMDHKPAESVPSKTEAVVQTTPLPREEKQILRPRISMESKRTEQPPPQQPKTPKERKESSAPRSSSGSDTKRDLNISSSPKTISQPPKPIMPGQKPPSQTALMLQQKILQQRQQQQKLQLQKQQQQQQQKLQMQKQLSMQKQMPSLQKLQSIQKMAASQIKSPRPGTSTSATSKPITPTSKPSPVSNLSQQTTSKTQSSVQTSSTPTSQSSKPQMIPPASQFTKPVVSTANNVANKQPMPTATSKPGPAQSKPGPAQSKPGPAQSKPGPAQSKPGPAQSKPGPVPSKPGPAQSKPAASSPTVSAANKPTASPSTANTNQQQAKPATPSSEARRDDSGLIDKTKTPVVVIERHSKKNPEKSPPPSSATVSASNGKEKSSGEHKKRSLSPNTTLTVAPGSSITKLKLVKRPATSPAGSPPVAKKVASETPKPAPPLEPLELRPPSDEPARHDDIGALDLSGKSSRKSDSPCSTHSSDATSPPAPSPTETRSSPAPKPTPLVSSRVTHPTTSKTTAKSQSPQTIMSIAQTLVNRQLSNLGFNGDGSRSPGSPHSQGSSSPSSQGSAGSSFRNLMTLTDTAVHVRNQYILSSTSQPRGAPMPQPRMRLPVPQQHTGGPRVNYGRGGGGASPAHTNNSSPGNMRSPTTTAPIRIPSVPTTLSKLSPPRTESSPMSPTRTPRINDLFPGPQSKPVQQNQAVRHIPNPSLLFRQQANRMQQQQQQQQTKKDEIAAPARNNHMAPSLSAIRRIENLTRNIGEGKAAAAAAASALGVRTAAEGTQ